MHIRGLSIVLLGLLGCSSIPSKEIQRPIVYTTTLHVNTTNRERYVTCLNEDEGISQIRQLLFTSNLEESWIYLPEKEEWHEVGRNEVNGNDGLRSSVDLDMAYIGYLLANNKNCVKYHFHKYDQDLENIIEKSDDLDAYYTKRIDNLYGRFSNSFASDIDLDTSVTLALFHKRFQPDGTLIHKVCSAGGVLEYSFTPEGLSYYDDPARSIDFFKIYRDAAFETFLDTNYVEQRNSPAIEILRIFSETFSDDYMSFTLRKYN